MSGWSTLGAALLCRTRAAIPGSGHVAAGWLLRHHAAHTQAIRAALDAAAQRTAPDAALMLQPIPMVRVSSPVFSETEEAAPPPTRLLEKLRRGKFVVSVEVDPPRGFDAAKMLEGARIARSTAPMPSTWPIAPWRACAWARWRCAC